MKKNRLIVFMCISLLMGAPLVTSANEVKVINTVETTETLGVVEKDEEPFKYEIEQSTENNIVSEEDDLEEIREEGENQEETTTEDMEDVYLGNSITEENQHALGDSSRKMFSEYRAANARAISSNQTNLPRIDFVDVSSHQGDISVSDFLNMKGQGITGVVVKLTEGTSYVNPYAESQIKNAKAAGLKVSAYHYSWFVNKKTAEAEARFFASIAKGFNLESSTVMVNDAEQGETNNGKLTENSGYFAATLKSEFGFSKTIHYSMASWFTPKILDMTKLGGEKFAWKAEFPYIPSKDNLLHTNSSAWQWASDTHFVGDSKEARLFDTNIDYTGTFSSPRDFEYVPIDYRSFINKENGAIYSEPYRPGVWRQDTTKGMLNNLIMITAKSQTAYGLWYEFSYTKDGINKVGWIKSQDLTDVINQKNNKQRFFVNKDYGAVYDTPYTETSRKVDNTSNFVANQFDGTKEARTGYGLWHYGSYKKGNITKYGWIKSVDLDKEKTTIEVFNDKGIINKNYGSIYSAPYMPGVAKQDTLDGLFDQVVTIKNQAKTTNGLWYESTYLKNGLTATGWIKSTDIDFVVDEKNMNKLGYINKSHGSVFDLPYRAGSQKIDTTANFHENKFSISKEARTGYGTWYYGSYKKNKQQKFGWIKSVDIDFEKIETINYSNKGFINKTYGTIYSSPYVPGVLKQDNLDGTMYNQVVTITEKAVTNSLWYKCTYLKNNTEKTGWINASDIDFVIDKVDKKQTLKTNKEFGSVFDTPYTKDSKKIDTTQNITKKEFYKTKEARTAFGLWYFGSYKKNGLTKTGWIKSVDFD